MRSTNGRCSVIVLVCLLLLIVLQALGSSGLSDLSNNSGASLFPAIAVSGQNIYVVWDDDSFGASEILYTRSADGGQTFSPPQNLSSNSGRSRNPAIAASGSDVFIVWDDDSSGNFEILYTVSHDGGQTFSLPQNLSQNAGRSVLPEIAVAGDNLYVVWQDDTLGNREIFYRRSLDGGRTFTTTSNLSKNSGRSLSPAIAASGSHVYVVWDDNTTGNHEIFYAHSSDGGKGFSAPQNISNSPSFSAAPTIAVSGSQVYVTWTEEFIPENYEIFYSWSSDGGGSFAPPRNISKTSAYSGASVVAAWDNDVHLAWIEGILIEQQGKIHVDYEVFYASSPGGGAEFTAPQNLSLSDGITVNPAIAISDGKIYIAFADDASGNFEVFLKILPK